MLFTHGLKSSGKQWTTSSMFYSTSRNDGVCFSILYESLYFSIQIYIFIHPASPQLGFLPPSGTCPSLINNSSSHQSHPPLHQPPHPSTHSLLHSFPLCPPSCKQPHPQTKLLPLMKGNNLLQVTPLIIFS
ncbi:hypothetical protein CHARACLAT_021494 [Characodon lateralis]|uniref:Uncharacterized protein n=1 Tax=Characodon lateralis TaxID=208331 RepID=A0ABU7D8Q7_9TELE|nr:hypothetical protein [Characodon lateralis]